MRLFGVVDSQINESDRATWQSGGPWWGFDLSYQNVAAAVYNFYDVQFSNVIIIKSAQFSDVNMIDNAQFSDVSIIKVVD